MNIRSLHRYSRYVTLMKIGLFVGIFLIIISIAAPYIASLFQKKLEVTEPVPPDNCMLHPHYMSTDKKGQPYEVTAEVATQIAEQSPTVLDKPEGSLIIKEGQTLTVKANSGIYDADNKLLKLNGDVTLTSTDGDKITTAGGVTVTLDQKVVQGYLPVAGSGPKGDFKAAGGFETRGKTYLKLKGRSQVVLKRNTGA